VISRPALLPAAWLLAVLAACKPLDSPQTMDANPDTDVAPAVVSGSNYTSITNAAPVPRGFRPFASSSIWNRRLPENPKHVDDASTALVRVYARNSSRTVFSTLADNFLRDCSDDSCSGIGGSYPLYVAAETDPAVTVDCAQAVYGCSLDAFSQTVKSIPGTFRIPPNARPGCLDNTRCGDRNYSVLQPNGDLLELYGCTPHRNWQSGDAIGGSMCRPFSGAALTNVVTGNGYNGGTITGGDSFISLMATYNEVVPRGARISHALEVRLTCSKGVVYPGLPLVECPQGTGLPSGALIHLKLSHKEIDALVTNGTYTPQMRPFLYALHDYGAYFLDTGGGSDQAFYDDASPRIEDATPWLRNGGTNPWIPWFRAQGAVLWRGGGTPLWSFRVNLYRPIASSLQVVSSCYALGTCSDSVPPVEERTPSRTGG